MRTPLTIGDAIRIAETRQFTHWVDERNICVYLDKFKTIFVSKYAPTGQLSEWSFALETEGNPRIFASNVSGFEYAFPLIKVRVDFK